MKLRHIVITFITLMAAMLPAVVDAQRQYDPHFAIGAHGGMVMSEMSFTPEVKQSMLPCLTLGLQVRYTEENIFGIVAELNLEQRGWREDFEGAHFRYDHTLTYVQLPVLTHIYFGSRKFKGFVNLGPSVSYLIGDKITSDFDYKNPQLVPDFPLENRTTEQMGMEVSRKFDYGILGGLGCELRVRERHSLLLEARYYFGLGNIFPDAKKDVFSASRAWSLSFTLGYLFHLK